MLTTVNDGMTGGRNVTQQSLGMSVFVLLCMVSLISSRSLSNSLDTAEVVPLAAMDSSMLDTSMPLWGGAAALNTSVSSIGFETEIKLHHFDQISCGNCHEALGTTEVSLVTENSDMKSTVNINRSCTSFGCHEYNQEMNHPVGVPTSRVSSVQLSLGASYEITCLTCHEDGSESATNESDNRVLIRPEPTICQLCHERTGDSQKERSHWRFSQKAHLISLISDSTMDNHYGERMISCIDWESQTCLTCHDEITANISGIKTMGPSKRSGHNNMSDHPIGVNYQDVLNTQSHFFNILGSDQNKVRMFDGRIGCGTCHSLYSKVRFHLAVSNEKSTLCRTCHNR